MSLYALKPWFVGRLRRAEDVLAARRVAPETVTAAGVMAAIACGAATAAGGMLAAPGLWWLVPPLALVRLACNALDGSLARRTGTARPAGVVLNEVADRVGDAAMIGGAAFVTAPVLAAAALAAAFLSALAGVLALATVGVRLASGPMGKADRVAVIAVAAFAAPVAGPAAFTVALVLVAGGAVLTAALRTRIVLRRLGEESRV